MPREKGTILVSSHKFKNNITAFCSGYDRTYEDIQTEFKISYKTAWKYVSELKEEGRLSTSGRRGNADTFTATNKHNIPHIPTPTGPINPVEIVKRVHFTKGNYHTKIEQLDSKFGQVICGIFRTAVVIKTEGVFPKDRHKELETYLRTYREELTLRLAQVNALLQTDKFWTEEGLKDFQHDPAFDVQLIQEAYQFSLNPEKKVE